MTGMDMVQMYQHVGHDPDLSSLSNVSKFHLEPRVVLVKIA